MQKEMNLDDRRVLRTRRLLKQALIELTGEKTYEEITIRDGRVWANGEMLTPPDCLQGIEYVTKIQDTPWEVWGSPDCPAKLGEDEYFVLGDFSPQSKDSRLWQTGAPGHPPFAVPESHIQGVVTHTFWPPGRWRVFR